MKEAVKKYAVKSKTVNVQGIEFTAEIRMKDGETAFVNRLNEISGVENATLVSYNGEYMSWRELLRDDPGSAEKDKTAKTKDEQKKKRREGGAEETQGCGRIKWKKVIFSKSVRKNFRTEMDRVFLRIEQYDRKINR